MEKKDIAIGMELKIVRPAKNGSHNEPGIGSLVEVLNFDGCNILCYIPFPSNPLFYGHCGNGERKSHCWWIGPEALSYSWLDIEEEKLPNKELYVTCIEHDIYPSKCEYELLQEITDSMTSSEENYYYEEDYEWELELDRDDYKVFEKTDLINNQLAKTRILFNKLIS
jgi:hypothetical protein